jgi:hypothetical protein
MVAKVRERLAVNKKINRILILKDLISKLNELQVRKQYQIEITNRFPALENLSDGEDINRTWENIKVNIQTSYKENLGLHGLKQHKLCFDEECLRFLDKTKQAKMQWVQDPTQNNVDILDNENVKLSDISGKK